MKLNRPSPLIPVFASRWQRQDLPFRQLATDHLKESLKLPALAWVDYFWPTGY
jgi:hypothetical protein